MIYSEDVPVTFSDALPASVDVVVIGAGVIGISTAWFLNAAGLRVLVCEKGRVAGEQSSRNWGWIRQQARDADELPIVIDSVNTWEQLARELPEDIGFERRGVMYAALDDQQLAEYEKWLAVAEPYQVDTRILSGAEVDALLDSRPGQYCGALYTASDGKAEPFKAVPALARELRRRGGLIRENCAVRTVERQAGRAAEVVTESGRVSTQAVVCASGAWTSLFLGNLGIKLPQLTVRATVARTAKAPDIYGGNASLGEIAIRRRQDGGYTIASSNTNEHYVGADSVRFLFPFLPALRDARGYIGLRFDGDLLSRLLPTRSWRADEISPAERQRVLNPEPSQKALRRMRDGMAKRVPKIKDIPFEEAWAGMIDVTPDVVPVMDEVSAGLFVATGFSGHGFGIGPGAGKIMADLVRGNKPAHDLSRFRFARFNDGTKMRPGPGL